MLNSSTLRPGLLVSLKTSITGNVSYIKEDIEPDHLTPSGKLKAKWVTERTIVDPAEHERAVVIRSKVRSLVRGVCAESEFGLLCPKDKAPKLEEVIAQARVLTEAFNAEAQVTRIHVYLMTGEVLQNDAEAIRAINSEVRELMDRMEGGIKRLDVKAVRDAAVRVKSIGNMLSPFASEKVKTAIDAARSAARKIVKAGEQAAQEIDLEAIKTITQARTAFLELEDGGEVAAPVAETRAIDFVPEEKGGKVERFRPALAELEME